MNLIIPFLPPHLFLRPSLNTEAFQGAVDDHGNNWPILHIALAMREKKKDPSTKGKAPSQSEPSIPSN